MQAQIKTLFPGAGGVRHGDVGAFVNAFIAGRASL